MKKSLKKGTKISDDKMIKNVLNQVSDLVEVDKTIDELMKVALEVIERYEQIQKIISNTKLLINGLKQSQDESITFEPDNWNCNRMDLEALHETLCNKFDLICLDKIELNRLEALLDKAGIEPENGRSSLEIYEEALGISTHGYKIIHKRDIDEIYVNNYNAEWIINWNGNMDLQLCLDYHAVITYISDYYSKDESGTLGHIKQALRKAENESLKTKLSLVIDQFLTHRQIGECEGFFKILPHLHMKWSNIETIFVPTGFKCNRSGFLKEISKEEARKCENVIKVANKEGHFIEKPSMMDKFERMDVIENHKISKLRYLQFCMKYTSTNSEPKDTDFESIEFKMGTNGWYNTEEMNLIVTDSFESDESHYSLPNFIKLKDLRPGEPKYMRRRSRQVARFHKINRTKHPHEYYFAELQLYSEFRREYELEEEDFDKCKLLYEQTSEHNNKLKVQNVKSILMKHMESVEEGTERAKDMLKSKVGDTLDPALEQDNDDCAEIGFSENPDFAFKDPTDFLDNKEDSKRYKAINLYDEETMDSMSRELDEDQRLVLEIGIDYAKSIQKSRKTKARSYPPLLVIQGGAGSGKSTVIDVLSQHMEKILRAPGDNPDHPYIIKAAFTGTAAANIKGQTMHNAFGFSFGNEFFSLGDKARDERRSELENLKVVIIDEFSMIKADMLYQLDLRLREVMQRPDEVFGGLSVFLFGDILQLRPVCARYIFEEPVCESFLLAFLISSLWQKFDVVVLRHNHRQGEDKEYADVLNRLRIGQVTDEDVQLLETRVRPMNHPEIPLEALVVSCRNVEVNKINEDRLATINETEYIFEARNYTRTQKQINPGTDAAGSIKGTPLQKQLKLKLGAKVMLTFNIDTCDCLTNGALGEVIGYRFDQNGEIRQVYVHFYDADCGKTRRKNFVTLQEQFPGKNATPIDVIEFHYSLSKKSNNSNSNATVIQFPLKLAFAATAHKVQGLTVKKPNSLVIDLRTVREAAQAYVILSRVQALCQLFIIVAVHAHKITACVKAMEELERMNNVAINLKQCKRVTIVSCNIRSLKKHFEDFITASAIKQAQVLCLQETWLHPSAETNLLEEKGWKQHNNSVGRGKGISTFYKPEFVLEKDVTLPSYQMTKIRSDSIDIINVYRSSGAENYNFIEDLCGLCNPEKHTLILGDFNICYNSQIDNQVYQTLRNMGFRQLVKHPTHIDGRLIDPVFSFSPGIEVIYEVKQQAQYYTDHDMIEVVEGKEVSS